ncbi:hypothetical protein K0A96_00190 [Patescibacteria group bacterium]|nr:hypothetical protein [Patescibacteria group bacterium]
MKNKNIKKIEIAGAVFGIIFGSILHFTYQLSGNNTVAALFSAVNESVWEHTKMFFFPVIFYLLIEWRYVLDKERLLLAKVVESLFGIGFIVGFYYFYILFIPGFFLIDITYFILTVIFAKYLSYKVITSRYEFKGYLWLHALTLILIAIFFFVTTFIPPELPVFEDKNTSSYGIGLN